MDILTTITEMQHRFRLSMGIEATHIGAGNDRLAEIAAAIGAEGDQLRRIMSATGAPLLGMKLSRIDHYGFKALRLIAVNGSIVFVMNEHDEQPRMDEAMTREWVEFRQQRGLDHRDHPR